MEINIQIMCQKKIMWRVQSRQKNKDTERTGIPFSYPKLQAENTLRAL